MRDARRARFFLAESMTATVFSPDWRRTSSTTVGTPSRRAAERCSLVPSSARPMSLTRTGAPLIVATTRSLNDFGSATRPIVRSDFSLKPAVTLPPGAYTVEVRGKNETEGVALLEIYTVP